MDSLVVKFGGSLLESVPELIAVIKNFPSISLLVVPGGGLFADKVRSLPIPDEEAHWMAIAAMEQFGWYIASRGLEHTDLLKAPSSPHVFLPYRTMREMDPLPHSWDVSSDTIAAWIASILKSELILLKSVDGVYHDGTFKHHVEHVFPCHEVDAAFLPYVLSHRIRCTILNGGAPDRLKDFLSGIPVYGTRIETTF